MKTQIIKPSNPLLMEIIQYFILFRSDTETDVQYTTFPNTNLCLSIYKQNKILISEGTTGKSFSTLSGGAVYKSYLTGFYKASFNVDISATIDEVCIILHPAALRFFSNISYGEILDSDEAFTLIFPNLSDSFIEQLFEEQRSEKRIQMLEMLFLKFLKTKPISLKVRHILQIADSNPGINVYGLASRADMSESALYRLFMSEVGQSPKNYLRTARFRKSLDSILHLGEKNLTEIAVENAYTDQSHFIHEFNEMTGHAPKKVIEMTSVQQQELAWIYSDR